MTRRVAVRGVALHNNKLLCVRHKLRDGEEIKPAKFWALPGGGLEEGESLIAGIEREMVEETGVKPSIGDLLYVQQFLHGEWEHIEFFFHITNAPDFLNVDLSKTTHGELEIAEINFIDPASAEIKPEFLASNKIHEFAGSGASTRIFNRL